MLAANVARLEFDNVTILNVAVSDSSEIRGMDIPKFETGLENFYMAKSTDASSTLDVLTISIDSLELPAPTKLARFDVEGRELSILQGLAGTIARDHSVLIVEDNSPDIAKYWRRFD